MHVCADAFEKYTQLFVNFVNGELFVDRLTIVCSVLCLT